ncbi:MAG: type II toxin-antitoxin system Phd/YefM family antitoxin [Gemmatimonadetes bacterium]|nr:type II toxin-antitoxin system Phd/YefM family antitoxin [Gemmatimonadota bacterium]
MDVYTYSEARQHLSSLLDEAESTGKVIIRRKDGRRYAVVPELPPASPLDVPLAGTDLTAKEVVKLVRRQRIRGKRWGRDSEK